MKKFFIYLLVTVMLAACSRDDLLAPPPGEEHYFSKVKRFTDDRAPRVDTVWTWLLFNQQMVDSFRQYDGYVYEETSTFVAVGVLWHK